MLPHQVAELEEARLARAIAELADEVLEVAGGVACYAGPASSLNLVVALGMRGPVSSEDLDRVVRFYDERGAAPEVALCPFAHPSAVRGLGARGFVVDDFDTVLSRGLDHVPNPPAVEGLTLHEVDPADPQSLEAFLDTDVACFAPEGGQRADALREDTRRIATVGSPPHGPTGRNALRAGFATAYTKALLVRPALALR